jgi:sodium pump decarboxylase gamma subunit
MESNFIASLSVSAIAMTTIFLVLGILIVLIKVLDRLLPYEEPPAPPAKAVTAPVASPAPASETDEHIAAIAAALSAYLGKSPDSFQITHIQSN